MPNPSNYQTIQNLYSANSRGDLEAFYKDLSPINLTWKESAGFPAPGVFRTKSEIAEHVFGVLERDWSHFRFELEYLIDGKERIVAVGTYRGTHRKTGKSFEARAAHVWRLAQEEEGEGGRIVEFEQFADTEVMWEAAT